MTEVARRDRARANFDALLAYKREGERRRIPDVIREIWAERQWEPLGFKSYGEACISILGPEWRNPWSIEDRREVVADLRGSGMSTRAIASAVGVSDGTVRTDLDQLRSSAQLPDTITGLDGKSRPATRPTVAVDLETGEILGETLAADVWEAEQGPSVDDVLAPDPDVRAANVRQRGTALLAYLYHPHPDAAELVSIDADLTTQIAERLTALARQYQAAIPRRLTVVKES